MKKCNKCGKDKDFSAFSKNRTSKDGLQNHCKVCFKEWRNNNKEYFPKYMKKYRAETKPCVYRIRHMRDGRYYLGQTARPLWERVSCHFHTTSDKWSYFTGMNKDDWFIETLCYGTAKEVRQIEKVLLSKRVGIDPNCVNKNR